MKTVYVKAGGSRKSSVRLLALLCLFGLGEFLGGYFAQVLGGEQKAEAARFLAETLGEGRRVLPAAWADFRAEFMWLLPLFFAGWTGLQTATSAALTTLRGTVIGFGGTFLWCGYTGTRLWLYGTLLLPFVFFTVPLTLLITELSERFFHAQREETAPRLRRRYLFLYLALWLIILIIIAVKSTLLGVVMHGICGK